MIVVPGRAEPAPFGRRRPRRRYAAPIAIASAGAWAGGVAGAYVPVEPENGVLADWASDAAPNSGGAVSGNWLDLISGQILAPTGAPTFVANGLNGHAT